MEVHGMVRVALVKNDHRLIVPVKHEILNLLEPLCPRCHDSFTASASSGEHWHFPSSPDSGIGRFHQSVDSFPLLQTCLSSSFCFQATFWSAALQKLRSPSLSHRPRYIIPSSLLSLDLLVGFRMVASTHDVFLDEAESSRKFSPRYQRKVIVPSSRSRREYSHDAFYWMFQTSRFENFSMLRSKIERKCLPQGEYRSTTTELSLGYTAAGLPQVSLFFHSSWSANIQNHSGNLEHPPTFMQRQTGVISKCCHPRDHNVHEGVRRIRNRSSPLHRRRAASIVAGPHFIRLATLLQLELKNELNIRAGVQIIQHFQVRWSISQPGDGPRSSVPIPREESRETAFALLVEGSAFVSDFIFFHSARSRYLSPAKPQPRQTATVINKTKSFFSLDSLPLISLKNVSPCFH